MPNDLVLDLIPCLIVWGACNENKKWAITTISLMLITQFVVMVNMESSGFGLLLAVLIPWSLALISIGILESIKHHKEKLAAVHTPRTRAELIEHRKRNYKRIENEIIRKREKDNTTISRE